MSNTSLVIRKKQTENKSELNGKILRIGGVILLAWLVAECLHEIAEIQNHYQGRYVNTFENLTKKRD